MGPYGTFKAARPRTGRVGRLVRATLPGVVLLAPWLFWKLSYYGDWLPNTFFAKVSEEPRWAEGAAYAWLYFGTYLGLVPGLVVVALWPLRTRAGGTGWGGVRAPWLIAALVSGWLLHVLRVGGDFMFARFLLPITPVLLLALEFGAFVVDFLDVALRTGSSHDVARVGYPVFEPVEALGAHALGQHGDATAADDPRDGDSATAIITGRRPNRAMAGGIELARDDAGYETAIRGEHFVSADHREAVAKRHDDLGGYAGQRLGQH